MQVTLKVLDYNVIRVLQRAPQFVHELSLDTTISKITAKNSRS